MYCKTMSFAGCREDLEMAQAYMEQAGMRQIGRLEACPSPDKQTSLRERRCGVFNGPRRKRRPKSRKTHWGKSQQMDPREDRKPRKVMALCPLFHVCVLSGASIHCSLGSHPSAPTHPLPGEAAQGRAQLFSPKGLR